MRRSSRLAIPAQPMHLLGTDALGRDIASRMLYAGRISLSVALIVTILTVTIGTIIGAVAGSFGGAIDTVLMRFTDLMLTLPTLPLLLVAVQQPAPVCSGCRSCSART